MNWLDIIFCIVSIFTIYRGFSNGLIVELCGLIGVVIGGYLAYLFSDTVISLLDINHTYASYVAFAIIMILALVAVATMARFISKLLKATGLGTIDRLLGAAVSFAKGVLVLSLLFIMVDSVNKSAKFLSEQSINESKTFQPTINIGNTIFPYIVEFASDCSNEINNQISKIESSQKSED